MKICWTVSTYNRPHLLPRIIACFEAQTHEDRYMVILDDAGQYGNQEGDRWKLVSTTERCRSLGIKRNTVIGMVPEGTEAIMPVDDDDLALPWHTEAAAKVLETRDWSRPSVVLTPAFKDNISLFNQNYTGTKADHTKNRLYHPAWAMRLKCVLAAGGYPPDLSGPEDQGLMLKMEAMGVLEGDPCEHFPPSYVYCWGNGNISGMLNRMDRKGIHAWKKLGSKKPQPATLARWEPSFNLAMPVVAPIILPRPF